MEITDKKNPFGEITAILYTKNEIDHFTKQIDTLSESLFLNKIDIDAKVNELFSDEMANVLNHIWKQNGIDTKNTMALQGFLAEIKDALKYLPVVTLTLAFKPKQPTIQRISTWLSFSFKKPLIIDVKVDRQIIGGAIVEYQGKHLAYTVHNILTENINTISSQKIAQTT